MRFGKCYPINALLFSVAALSMAVGSCKKESGIDNNNVIETPYGLFAGRTNGLVENTNDGLTFKPALIQPSGVAVDAITTSGTNVMMVQYNPLLHHPGRDLSLMKLGENNFNPVPINSPTYLSPSAHWQQMILDVPSQGAVYAAGTSGIIMSPDNGLTWTPDPQNGQADITKVTSFTQTRDGRVYALDNVAPNVISRTGTFNTNPWQNPASPTTGLPTGDFFISHINNTLAAADHKGSAGVYFCTDQGVTWTQYEPWKSGVGAPTQQVLSLAAPFDQVLLAGMDTLGIMRLEGDAFVPSNNGLEPYTSVYGIVGKENIYKGSGTVKRYIYIATNKGLFRSEDYGRNWTKMRNESYSAAY